MSYPSNVGRLTFSGTHAVDEEWSFGFHTGPVTMNDSVMDDIEAAFSDWFQTAANGFVSGAKASEIKYALLAPNGRYANDSQPFLREIDPQLSGGSATSYVPQATVVVSLETSARRGLAHAGRFYPPPTTMRADSSNGRLASATVSSFLASTKTFLDAVNLALAEITPGGDLGITVASSIGSGQVRSVTGIRVGDVIDTQRRRRRQLPEVYQSVALDS